MSNTNPIGVFDSGLGGLTVVKALRKTLPNESVVYLGDTARVPYGNKSAAAVQEYSLQNTEFLIARGAKMIVVACNTASALALDRVRKKYNLPVIGVIEPGVEAALKTTRNKRIGVIGTIATINSKAYEHRLKAADGSILVVSQSCPLLVPLAEEGWLEGEITESIVRTYLKSINQARVDTLILGCTHYPLLKPVIKSQLNSGTILVDSADAVAIKTTTVLEKQNLKAKDSKTGLLNCFVTDIPARFETIARRFLGQPLKNISTVHLP